MADKERIALFFECIDALEPEKKEELKQASIATMDQPFNFYVTDPAVTDAIEKDPELWFMIGSYYAATFGEDDEPSRAVPLPIAIGRISEMGNEGAKGAFESCTHVLSVDGHTGEQLREVLAPLVELAQQEGFRLDYQQLLADVLDAQDDGKAVAERWTTEFADLPGEE